MTNLLSKILIIILVLYSSTSLSKDICFSDKEAERIIERLEKDKRIIKWQKNRWDNLINTIPKIKYEIVDDVVIIQTIEFPVKDDKPLVYEVKMRIIQKAGPRKLFPFTFSLCGMFESAAVNKVDAKVGIQIINFSPINIKYLRNIGLHCLVGAQSTGLSISWKVSKYLRNTRIHLYNGLTYDLKKSYGIGISLNF